MRTKIQKALIDALSKMNRGDIRILDKNIELDGYELDCIVKGLDAWGNEKKEYHYKKVK